MVRLLDDEVFAVIKKVCSGLRADKNWDTAGYFNEHYFSHAALEKAAWEKSSGIGMSMEHIVHNLCKHNILRSATNNLDQRVQK